MSLIHDALRQSAAASDGTRPVPARALPPRLAQWPRRPAVWLLAGALVAGPVGFLLSRPTPAPAPAPTITAIMPVTAVMPMPASSAPPPQTRPASMTIANVPAMSTLPPPAAAPRMARPDAAPASYPLAANNETTLPAAAQVQVSVRQRDAASDKGNTGDETDSVAVRMAMNALNAAVGIHDDAATASAIERLQALLPPQSLTLLRARAWAAHAGGNPAEAERLYRAILDRVPDDETAGVNLALLDAQRGEVDDARARLGRMAARNARSPQVARALAELDAARQ